jgi:hypothetical protein
MLVRDQDGAITTLSARGPRRTNCLVLVPAYPQRACLLHGAQEAVRTREASADRQASLLAASEERASRAEQHAFHLECVRWDVEVLGGRLQWGG